MNNIKKISILVLVLLTVVTVNSCFGKNKNNDDSIGVSSVESSGSAKETEAEEIIIQSPIYKVEIKNETVEKDNIKASLLYPKISGYENSESEEKVNAIIRSHVESKMNETATSVGLLGNNGDEICYEIKSFDVTTKNNNILSAVCRGSISDLNGTYTADFSYGINVDLKNSKLLGLDSVVDFSGVVKDFSDGNYKQTYGYKNLLDEANYKDLISQYDGLYGIYPEYYIRTVNENTSLGIIVETVPVLGYFAEFEADITNKSYIKNQFVELIK